jgi:hypothetical protein
MRVHFRVEHLNFLKADFVVIFLCVGVEKRVGNLISNFSVGIFRKKIDEFSKNFNLEFSTRFSKFHTITK